MLFVSLIFMLMGVSGLMFLMPVAMVLSSFFGIIKPAFWQKYWRHAVFAFVLITAVITPDGSGITMAMLTVPLCLLYVGGMLVSLRYARQEV
jgi:sec-independent protein translocase protein TatC